MLDVRGLTVAYPDGTVALSNLSFHVKMGECVAVVGANGAGKSTLLSALVGLMSAREGSIRVGGLALSRENMKAIRARVGLVFQNPDDQLFTASVSEDIAFGPRNYGLPRDEVARRVDETLGALGIERLRNRMPNRLSGGEKRVAALGCVLSMRPDVLLMDEPSSFLDPRARRDVMRIIGAIPATRLIATHDLDMALQLCSRVIALKDGALFADGGARELLLDEARMEACGLELPLSAARTIGSGEGKICPC